MQKRKLIKLQWFISSQLGFYPLRLLKSLYGLTQYFRDWWKFRQSYYGQIAWMPCLHDRYTEGGSTKSEYFWQDLTVARWIYSANPDKHVDIGSRVDGFTAHVASFREIEVFDVRPISTKIPGVVFRQVDLMSTSCVSKLGCNYCDSLSCLHAIEHFGLGRYGDPIDPVGHEKGIANMAFLLRPGGTFYLSTPIGLNRVEFNANRVFDPRYIVSLCESCGLKLCKMYVIAGSGGIQELKLTSENLDAISSQEYSLGVLVFKKYRTPK